MLITKDECNSLFPIKDNYVSLVARNSTIKAKLQIKTFWNELCKEWYSKLDETLTSEILYDSLEEPEKMFRVRKHLAVTEMDLSNLKGKNVLEIGSGEGGHSALFKRYGTYVTSLYISEERVASTAKKLSLVKEGTGIAFLADAEIYLLPTILLILFIPTAFYIILKIQTNVLMRFIGF